MTTHFHQRITSHSRSAVKLDMYGYKFYVVHVLRQRWEMPRLIRPPKTSRLPDIVTVQQAQALFAANRVLNYRVFFFTLYSLGLRLSEGLVLSVADIDAQRCRVHVRDFKGNRDRFVPLPAATLDALRRRLRSSLVLSCVVSINDVNRLPQEATRACNASCARVLMLLP